MAANITRFVVNVEAASDGGRVGDGEGTVAGVDVGIVAGPGGIIGPA